MSVSRTLKILMLGVLITLPLITACSGNGANHSNTALNPSDLDLQSSDSSCQFIQHKLGLTKVCTRPQKLAALTSDILEILLTLQVQPAGYGQTSLFHRGDFDNPSRQIPYLGSRVTSKPINVGVYRQPSLEKLLMLKPDLIVGSVELHRNKYNLLSQIAPTLLVESFKGGEWQRSIQVIAKALGRTQKAQKVVEQYNQHLESARKQLAPVVAAHPKVLMLLYFNLKQNLYLVNGNDPCNHFLKELGFQLVSLPGKGQQLLFQQISLELLPQLDSDLIFVQAPNIRRQPNQFADALDVDNDQLKDTKQAWNNNALAQSMRASQQGRVYFMPSAMCSGVPGPLGAEIFLKQLRQQLLPPKLN